MTPGYVALVRGVNVGGRSSLKMDALRAAFTDLGFEQVSTYIQSGNVVFAADSPPDAGDLGAALGRALDRELIVMVRTGAYLRAMLDATPFPSVPPSARHIGFLAAAPARSTIEGLDLAAFAPEEAVILGAEVHVHLPNGMGRAKLPLHLGRVLDEDVTYRNWNTVTKLAELAGAP